MPANGRWDLIRRLKVKGMNSKKLRWTECVESMEEITNDTESNLQTRGTRNYKS